MSRAMHIRSSFYVRCRIDDAIIAEALHFAAAARTSKSVRDYVDAEQRYLVLRQHGSQVGWFVRGKRQMRRIGSAKPDPYDPEFLDLKKARQKAARHYYALGPRGQPPSEPPWTWAQLSAAYLAYLGERRYVGHRIKPPSPATLDDVQLCFDKQQLAAWQNLKVTELTPWHLIKLLDDVHRARGHRSAEKAAAYIKAALNWALSQRTIKSGLCGVLPWWVPIQPPQPTAPEIDTIEIRLRDLTAAKDACTVEYLGEVLVKHEQYCAGRQGNRRISPGVRFAFWWIALTANRRCTGVKLQRNDLKPADPRNKYATADQPWGTAEWPSAFVKNKTPFMLPIPPIGLHVANASMWDWKLRAANKRGFCSRTRWVFASGRRPRPQAGAAAIADPSIYPNSLNAHFRALRGRKKSGSNKVDYLAGRPPFWLHLVRSAMTNYFGKHELTVPRAAASVMLGHALPDDKALDWLRISRTTEKYYLTYQHMDLKALAMQQWCAALLQAYVNAGGTLPMPYESDPAKENGPDWVLPTLPVKQLPAPRPA